MSRILMQIINRQFTDPSPRRRRRWISPDVIFSPNVTDPPDLSSSEIVWFELQSPRGQGTYTGTSTCHIFYLSFASGPLIISGSCFNDCCVIRQDTLSLLRPRLLCTVQVQISTELRVLRTRCGRQTTVWAKDLTCWYRIHTEYWDLLSSGPNMRFAAFLSSSCPLTSTLPKKKKKTLQVTASLVDTVTSTPRFISPDQQVGR